MRTTIGTWWRGLNRREKILVAVAGTLAGAVLLWLLVIRPFGTALEAQRADLVTATERQGRISAKVALLKSARPAAANGTITGPLDQWLTQSASERGFVLDRNEARGADQVTLAMASARAPALLAWMAQLEAQGLIADTLTVTPGANGTVAIVAELRRTKR